jgi:NAD(P)-dependent dehydrogenase (short-subunit alcohol dehydrogenase family)
MSGTLTGRRALVTGAAVGLGRAYALALANEGAAVAVCDVAESVHDLAKQIAAAGVPSFAMVADVADARQVKSFVDAAAQALGGLDIVVSNAGVVRVTNPAQDSFDQAVDDYDYVVDVNMRGVYLTGRAAIPHLIKNGGDLINVTTDHIHTCGWPEAHEHDDAQLCAWKDVQRSAVGGPGFDVYDASKWGIKGFTNAWARGLASHGVRVNSFGMGATATPMYLGFLGDRPTAPGVMTPEGVASVLVDLINEGPNGRTGDSIQLWAGHPTVLPPPMLDGILCAADLARAK